MKHNSINRKKQKQKQIKNKQIKETKCTTCNKHTIENKHTTTLKIKYFTTKKNVHTNTTSKTSILTCKCCIISQAYYKNITIAFVL